MQKTMERLQPTTKSQSKHSQLLMQFSQPQPKPTIWQERDPTPDVRDRVPHISSQHLDTDGLWQLVGVSRRGKAHAHQGRFRDDAFALGQARHWHMMVVADGGGSRPLARVGANLAAQTAVEVMKGYIQQNNPNLSIAHIAERALKEGLKTAWEAIKAEADRRQTSMRNFGTTFLSLIHCQTKEGSLIGVTQIGDGLVAAQIANDKVLVLVEPDQGQERDSTLFLTSFHWSEWVNRISVGMLQQPPKLMVAMSDGVANDFMPYDQYLPKLFEYLTKLTYDNQPDQTLTTMLGYQKQDSYDDRTVTMLYQKP